MGMKSKYNFLNHCYNDIMKFIIDLIPVKHNMSKYLYQPKKIIASLEMDYEKIDTYKKIACCSGRIIKTILNVCIAIGPDM
jgi:hypothetical protein